jgi:hypothetical protein
MTKIIYVLLKKPRNRGVITGNQKRRQAMSRNILLGYSGSLVGGIDNGGL